MAKLANRYCPREPAENALYRGWLLEKCRQSPEFRSATIKLCRDDPLYYVNSFVWQYNPVKTGTGVHSEVGPFATWEFQDSAFVRVLDHIDRGEDLLVEKSREMGWSWLVLIAFDYLSRFRRRKNFLCVSHSEAAVWQPGNPNSLFWKLRYVQDHVPRWLGEVHRLKNSFHYLDQHSYITGSANTVKTGVGGRATAILLDEFAKQPNAESIWHDTADTSRCRIVVSTHYGIGTKFFDLSRAESPKKIVSHWLDHPEKRPGRYRFDPETRKIEVLDPTYPFPESYEFVREAMPTGGPHPGVRSPWYDLECVRRGSRQAVAMHLDIDAQGSGSQFFDAVKLGQLMRDSVVAPYWQGDVLVDPDRTVVADLVESSRGTLRFWFTRTTEGKAPAMRYAVGVDVSAGTGATPSCLSVGNERAEKVAEFESPFVKPEELAPIAVALCRFFADASGRPAQLVWELQGPGMSFGDEVARLGHTQVWRAPRTNERIGKQTTRAGFTPNRPSKLALLETYRAALQTRALVVRSAQSIESCRAFEYTDYGVEHGKIDTGDPSGSRVNHGDMTIADALMWLVAKHFARPAGPVFDPERPPEGSILHRRQIRERRRQDRELFASEGR